MSLRLHAVASALVLLVASAATQMRPAGGRGCPAAGSEASFGSRR